MKKVYILAIAFIVITVIVGGTLVFFLKNRTEPISVENETTSNEIKVAPPDENTTPGGTTAEGDTSNKDFPIGVIDGVIESVSDIASKHITIKADVEKVFPNSATPAKVIDVSISDAEIFTRNSNGDIVAGKASDMKAGYPVSIALIGGQTNKDILLKDKFTAARISFFPTLVQ